MKKVILRLNCGNGMDSNDPYLVTEEEWAQYQNLSTVDDTLSQYAWEAAVDFASSYGIYPESDMPEDYDEEEADPWHSDVYSEDINGHFEEYSPEKHDGLMVACNEWDWKEL